MFRTKLEKYLLIDETKDNISLKLINDYIYKRMGHKRTKYDESVVVDEQVR